MLLHDTQATRIAYGGNRDFRRVVTLDGALLERSGTMSGGGGMPRGGKMGTSIRSASVSRETFAKAEKDLSEMVDALRKIRQRIADAEQRHQVSDKAVGQLEMSLARSQHEVVSLIAVLICCLINTVEVILTCFVFRLLQIDSLTSEHSYLKNQLRSLEAASKPNDDELKRLQELRNIILEEEKEIDRLMLGSKKLKEKVCEEHDYIFF